MKPYSGITCNLLIKVTTNNVSPVCPQPLRSAPAASPPHSLRSGHGQRLFSLPKIPSCVEWFGCSSVTGIARVFLPVDGLL
ncbi:unnamed protein product [Arabidopsis lyrata]|nr:unnamed protein product [Arabidopsis lyrata]